MDYIRVWKEFNIDEIKEHLLVVDELTGFCRNCKQIGIELNDLTNCPSCGREFKYITSPTVKNSNFAILRRIMDKLPHMIFIDYNDYDRLLGKNKAENLFNL